MEEEKNKIINSFKDLLCNAQTSLFSAPFTYTQFETLCRDYLNSCGYVLKAPINEAIIETAEGLCDIFYQELTVRTGRIFQRSPDRDKALARNFVDRIMEYFSCSKEASLKLCASIINTLINYEHYFNLKYPITDFGIFVDGNIGWISKKAFIIKDNPSTYTEDASFNKEWEKFIEEYIEKYGEESLGFNL